MIPLIKFFFPNEVYVMLYYLLKFGIMNSIQMYVFPSGPKVAELKISEGFQRTPQLWHFISTQQANRAMIIRNAEQLPGTGMKLNPSFFILISCLQLSSVKIPFFSSASFLNAVLVMNSSF